MNLLVTRHTRSEAEAIAQAMSNGIDYFQMTCHSCKQAGPRNYCAAHQEVVGLLKRLKLRFQFPRELEP